MDEVTRLAHDSVATASGADWGRFAPGTLLAGRFRIVAPLGRGGMGEVYRAEDLKLGQIVALKFLPEHLSHDPVRLAQFHNEVRVARTISHRNVCGTYDIDDADGRAFVALRVTPPAVRGNVDADTSSAVDWSPLFEAAALPFASFHAVPARSVPAAYADATAAFKGVMPGVDRSVRVQQPVTVTVEKE